MTTIIITVFIFALLSNKLVNCESCGPIADGDVDLLFVNDITEIESNRINIKNAEELLRDSNFNEEKSTIIYAFDFLETFNSKSVKIIVESFLKRGDHNVVILDYSKLSGGNYFFDAVSNIIKIGKLLGNILIKLNDEHGFDIDNLTLVGFSLGAHLMGEVGREVQKASNNSLKISKIIGLDPSGPAFYPLNPYVIALNRNDAEFVQIIHTDSSYFGIPESTGHTDFFPNGGKDQPNCLPFDKTNSLNIENQCSHLRSVEYFAESVQTKTFQSFDSVSCDTWESFKNFNCFESKPAKFINHMGMSADSKLFGNFYLQTNGEAEFSRGKYGLIYVDSTLHSYTQPLIFSI